MATYRIGIGSEFQLKDNAVGVGSTTTGLGNLIIDGTLKASGLSASGVTTFISYSGFSANEVSGKITLTGEHQTTGDIVVGTGETFRVSSGSTVDVGTVESVSIGTHFSPPTGNIEDRPEVPIEGTVRYNRDLNTLEFYNGVEWRQFTVSGKSGRVVGFGGYIGSPADRTTNIGLINAFSFGNAVSFGELTGGTTRMQFAGQSGNSTRGLCACTWPSNLDLIQYLTLASEGNSIDFGNLTSGRQQGGVTSSSTRSVFAGGAGGGSGVSTMEYVQITTKGDALPFGDLSVGRRALGGAGDSVRGIYSGGGDGSNLGANDDFITIASTGSAVKFRDSGRFCRNTKLASNSVRVVYVLGLSEAPANDSQKVLEKLSIASLGQTTEFGEMMAPKNDPSFVGAGNRGIMFGGWSPNSPAFVNVIEMVNITTTGDGVDFGDYNIVAAQVASTSDCHGGVGGF